MLSLADQPPAAVYRVEAPVIGRQRLLGDHVLDEVDRGLQRLAEFVDEGRVAAVEAERDQGRLRLHQLEQLAEVLQPGDHRLLDEHGLAGRDRRPDMPEVVRLVRADHHRVGALIREEFVDVGRDHRGTEAIGGDGGVASGRRRDATQLDVTH